MARLRGFMMWACLFAAMVGGIVCAAACSKSPPVSNQTVGMNSAVPNWSLVVVKDLESFVEDCACTGAARGGLARIASAKRASEGLYCFVGSTVFNTRAVSQVTDESEKRSKQLAYQLRSFLEYAKGLGSTVVIGEDHLESARMLLPPDLKAWQQLEPLLSRDSMLATPIGVAEVGVDGVKLPGTDRTMPYAASGSRGRRVLVVDVLFNSDAPARDKASAGVHWSQELSGLMPLYRTSRQARDKADSVLSELIAKQSTVATAYYLLIDDSVSEDPDLGPLADALRFDKLHSGLHKPKGGFVSATRAQFLSSWQTCGTCHPGQFNAWKASRHSFAFETLLHRQQSGDARCASCHTLHGGSAVSGHGVTCMNCHQQGPHTVTLGTCEACHTEATDPLGHYRRAFTSICSTSDTPPIKESACAR